MENNKIFPAVGFEIEYYIGSLGDYTSYDIYGFDQYEFMMGIRIYNLTHILPTLADANHLLTAITDPELTLLDQNNVIIEYMNFKYNANVPILN